MKSRNKELGAQSAMVIQQLKDPSERQKVSRSILEDLPEWFGIPEAREEYIAECAHQQMFCAYDDGNPIGFLSLKETSKDTLELSVLGVFKAFQRNGVGRALFLCAKEMAIRQGYSFLQVKTVQMGKYESYDRTNRFYLSLGFKELEVFPTLWDEWNPCQIYIMGLN